jgi:hypothetical protein
MIQLKDKYKKILEQNFQNELDKSITDNATFNVIVDLKDVHNISSNSIEKTNNAYKIQIDESTLKSQKIID